MGWCWSAVTASSAPTFRRAGSCHKRLCRGYRCDEVGVYALLKAWDPSAWSSPTLSEAASGPPRSISAAAAWSSEASQPQPFRVARPIRSWRRVRRAAPEERNSFVMPDFVGRGEDDAINEIVGAGFHVGGIASQPLPASDSTSEEEAVLPSRVVVRTTPAAGQRIYEGQGIGLEVTR